MVHIVESTSDEGQLRTFFKYMYENEEGHVYVAHKIPGNQYKFNQTFFYWPTQLEELIQHVVTYRPKYEVYYAPALFSAPSALKEHIKGARVFWCEFDGKLPTNELLQEHGIPQATLRIQSSAGHEHWYWKTDKLMGVDDLERVNRALTYALGADTSGWDANQILRPPSTFNHKRQAEVGVAGHLKGTVDMSSFAQIQPPPPLEEMPVPSEIPDVNEVIFRFQFPEHVSQLFRVGAPVGKRSETMMALGYYLAEMNLSNEEMLSVLLNADQRWGKFSGRSDQLKRLMEIITIARQKFPYNPSVERTLGHPALQPMGFLTLLRSDVHIEWVWDGWLQKKGYMLLTGPSGIGKTQLSLDVAGAMALGKPALDSPTTPTKVGFFSLEMNLPELKEFLQLMAVSYSQEEQEQLEENLQIFPLGEPLYMNRSETREQIEQTVSDFGLDGIIIDSMGSSTDGSLADEKTVKQLIDWTDSFRQRSGAFTWFIHHHRKASGENKRPNKLEDVYGNQYITARATSVVCLWDAKIANTLDFIPLKVRLRANPGKFHIKRGADLRFTRMAPGIVQEQAEVEPLTSITVDETPQGSEFSI